MRSNKDREFENEVIDEEVKVKEPKKYIVTVTNLALRKGPGFDYDRIGIAEAGHTLVSEIKDGWAKLADNSGWVNADYIRKVD